MTNWLVICGLLVVGQLESRDAEFDPVQETIETGSELDSFSHSIREELGEGGDASKQAYDCVLYIDETRQRIRIGGVIRDGDQVIGLDQSTLKLQWLDPGRMIHISWETVIIGSGRNQAQGNLILMKLKGSWREVFRDWSSHYSRAGADDYNKTSLEFEWIATRNTLSLKSISETSERGTEPGPLMEPQWVDDKGLTHYTRLFQFETVWEGRLNADKFEFDAGTGYFVPNPHAEEGDQSAPSIKEVSEFLSEGYGVVGKRTPAQQFAILQQRNPGLSSDGACPKRLSVSGGIPPYEASTTELYRTGGE